MKKRLGLILCIVVLTLLATQVFAEYDEAKVKKVMQTNGAHMGVLQKAAKNNDFFLAAETLMNIAKEMKSLDEVSPPKGSKEDWDKSHQIIINMAFQGIGACGEEDSEKLSMYIGEIGKLIKEGHGVFR